MRISAAAGWLVLLSGAMFWAAAQTPAVTYSRSFPGSNPVYFQIAVARDGHARYEVREKTGEPLATLTFTASPRAVGEIFADVAALHDFAKPPLQSKLKVAYTGDKQLAYADGSRHYVQHFTYTTRKRAAALSNLFEAMSVTGVETVRLRRALQYQPLDVLEIMDQIQRAWSAHQMAAPQLLEPTLEAALANGGIMTAAQRRARRLLAEFAQAQKQAEMP
ncbi:MAG: hypothetical protein ACRD1Y_09355 [Terriglobales bacterium]